MKMQQVSDLQSRLGARLDEIEAGPFPGELTRRAERRRNARLLLQVGGALAVVATALWVGPILIGEGSNQSQLERIDIAAGNSETPYSARCSVEPWSRCDTAAWAREVAKAAGFEVTGDTGSALEINRDPWSFSVWVVTLSDTQARGLKDEGYEPAGTVDDVRVLSDGDRLTWDVNEVTVFLSGVEGINASTGGVVEIVRASVEVGWP
jgi:hypothetical protein